MLFAASSIVIACMEAFFFMRASGVKAGRGLRCVYAAIYVLMLFGVGVAVQHINTILQFSQTRYLLMSYIASFGSRFAFGLFVLKMHWAASASAGLITITVKQLVDTSFPFFSYMIWSISLLLINAMPPMLLFTAPSILLQIFVYGLLLRFIYCTYWCGAETSMYRYLPVVLFPCTLLIFSLDQSMGVVVEEIDTLSVCVVSSLQSAISRKTFFVLLLSFLVFFSTLSAYKRITDSFYGERVSVMLMEDIRR